MYYVFILLCEKDIFDERIDKVKNILLSIGPSVVCRLCLLQHLFSQLRFCTFAGRSGPN